MPANKDAHALEPRHKIQEREPVHGDIRHFIHAQCLRKCVRCGKPITYAEFTLEHVIPISKGGNNDPVNLVALCEKCNLEKGNDIIPPLEYYLHLPENRKKELEELFQKYLASFDWLSWDNLFMTDWFTVQFYRHSAKGNINGRGSHCHFSLSCEAKIMRMTKESTIERLVEFKKCLDRADQPIIKTDIDDIDEPFYSVSIKDKELAFFSASIVDAREYDNEHWTYAICIDWFTLPVNKWRYGIEATIWDLMTSISFKMQETLLHGSDEAAIPIMFRMAESSPFAEGVMYVARKMNTRETVKLATECCKADGLHESHISTFRYITYHSTKYADRIKLIRQRDDRFYIKETEVFPAELEKTIVERVDRSRAMNRKKGRT